MTGCCLIGVQAGLFESMRYIDFTVNDFALDEYFQCWVLNSGDESVQHFWESWLLEHPE